jgi:hypothetical protein
VRDGRPKREEHTMNVGRGRLVNVGVGDDEEKLDIPSQTSTPSMDTNITAQAYRQPLSSTSNKAS